MKKWTERHKEFVSVILEKQVKLHIFIFTVSVVTSNFKTQQTFISDKLTSDFRDLYLSVDVVHLHIKLLVVIKLVTFNSHSPEYTR